MTRIPEQLPGVRSQTLTSSGKPEYKRIPKLVIFINAPPLEKNAEAVLKRQWKRFWQLRLSGGDRTGKVDASRIRDGMLLHQTRYGEAVLANILKSGILSGELGYEGKKTQVENSYETHYCADFFVNYGEKSVQEYITRAFSNAENIGRLKRPNMESFACPKENNENIAFVIDPTNRNLASLFRRSATSIHASILAAFSVRFPLSPDRLERAKRHLAVLVGIPANYFSFIIIGGKLAGDNAKLTRLKSIISNSGLELPVVNHTGELV